MERIVLRHLKGSKAGQTEEFPLGQSTELTFGREASANIKFDPDRDDVVGRVHAKLVQNPKDPHRFELADLNSRNGTFLNRQRVSGAVAIAPGDVIQLGAGGPEIQFDLDPRPAHLVKSTRLAMPGTETAGSAAATRVEGSLASAEAPKGTVGKATVERMMTGVQSESRRNLMAVGGIAAALIAAVAIYQASATKRAKTELSSTVDSVQAENKRRLDSLNTINENLAGRVGGLNSKEIFEKYSRAVVAIQFGWHLSWTRRGEQVYHKWVGNSFKDRDTGKSRPIMLDGRQVVAAYYAVGDRIVPALTTDPAAGWSIGQEGTGTGFVVTNDGFILTNRHVGAGWRTTYDNWSDLQLQGVLMSDTDKITVDDAGNPVLVWAPTDWVPSEAAGPQLQGGYEGVLDYLNVYFRGNTTPFRTNDQPRVSDRHDVSLIKIASASNLPKVDLDFDAVIEPGTRVSLMGYPGISVAAYTGVRSQEMFKKGPEVRQVPDPTLTGGMVSKVVKGRQMTTDGKDPTWSPFGDVYQLDILATGGGNSGGPLITEGGKVIGIYFASRSNPQSMERVTFAVPIGFAKELITIDENVPLR